MDSRIRLFGPPFLALTCGILGSVRRRALPGSSAMAIRQIVTKPWTADMGQPNLPLRPNFTLPFGTQYPLLISFNFGQVAVRVFSRTFATISASPLRYISSISSGLSLRPSNPTFGYPPQASNLAHSSRHDHVKQFSYYYEIDFVSAIPFEYAACPRYQTCRASCLLPLIR